ncbi:hypothetical protein BP422_21490 [Brevibacillus formosus]|uniref:Uncharacterized protein n=1 Tax=Brevibacillus formosus TaxID=54913 RepID=A0A220MLA9_9BACL|nr:hypothetical protein BP422_21490 [Brevibacillus formosus]
MSEMARRPAFIAEGKYFVMTAILSWCGLAVVSSMYVTIPMVTAFVREFQVSPAQAHGAAALFRLPMQSAFCSLRLYRIGWTKTGNVLGTGCS